MISIANRRLLASTRAGNLSIYSQISRYYSINSSNNSSSDGISHAASAVNADNDAYSASSRDSNIKGVNNIQSNLPFVYSPKNHLYRGMKSTKSVLRFLESQENSNDIKTKKSYISKSFDSVMKDLTIPLTNYVKVYKSFMTTLHPFEATVAHLTLVSREKAGKPKLDDILNRILELRNSISVISKRYAKEIEIKKNSKEITEHYLEGLQKISDLIVMRAESVANSNSNNNSNSNSSNSNNSSSNSNNSNGVSTALSRCLDDLMDLQKALRSVPSINMAHPSVVFVGCPNVGKSSIIRSISSGKPEVNNYPFTTRGITVGHIVLDDVNGISIQVMDTPGLLDRPVEERNEMEMLTYASMLHLPSAVVFVLDPTDLAGPLSTLDKQLRVREYLKSRFPKRPWLDVVSKCDLLFNPDGSHITDDALLALKPLGIPLASSIEDCLPKGHIKVSMKNGMNKQLVHTKIKELVRALMLRQKEK